MTPRKELDIVLLATGASVCHAELRKTRSLKEIKRKRIKEREIEKGN